MIPQLPQTAAYGSSLRELGKFGAVLDSGCQTLHHSGKLSGVNELDLGESNSALRLAGHILRHDLCWVTGFSEESTGTKNDCKYQNACQDANKSVECETGQKI